MILNELMGNYNYVYTKWKNLNVKFDTPEAAYSAGYIVCYDYESPYQKEAKAGPRGELAKKISMDFVSFNL